MSGLLVLLDDVVVIVKVVVLSVDDVVVVVLKVGSKVVGLVIDDVVVMFSYVIGFKFKCELLIIWKIIKGLLFNKLIILLFLVLLLLNFVLWIIMLFLMLGGCYLCFEGVEKVFYKLVFYVDYVIEEDMDVKDFEYFEEFKVCGVIKIDFILFVEIMVLLLFVLCESVLDVLIWLMVFVLVLVGVMIMVLVYGVVVLIVKVDDVGLYLV